MTSDTLRQTSLSMLVARVRTKRVERLMERVQRQRERAHRRRRERLLSAARNSAFGERAKELLAAASQPS